MVYLPGNPITYGVPIGLALHLSSPHQKVYHRQAHLQRVPAQRGMWSTGQLTNSWNGQRRDLQLYFQCVLSPSRKWGRYQRRRSHLQTKANYRICAMAVLQEKDIIVLHYTFGAISRRWKKFIFPWISRFISLPKTIYFTPKEVQRAVPLWNL